MDQNGSTAITASHDGFITASHDGFITASHDGFTVDAELVAGKLGLSPDVFWQELKRGIVYGVVERGEGEDAGSTRLTFRYRARSWSVTLEHAVG
jgi:hypothetical protein